MLRQTATELNDLREEIDRHRREQLDDLMTFMLHLTGEQAMTDGEILSTAVLLLSAGYDTTAKTMSNCLIALEGNPDQRQRVAADPSLVPATIRRACAGSVRCSLFLTWWPRTVPWVACPSRLARSCTVDRRGQPGSSPLVRPWAFRRFPGSAKSHLAFGSGHHLCLGAPLARLEMKVAIEQLLTAWPPNIASGISTSATRSSSGDRRPASSRSAYAARVGLIRLPPSISFPSPRNRDRYLCPANLGHGH